MSRLLPLALLLVSCSTTSLDQWVDVQGARVHTRVIGPEDAPVVILNGGAGEDLSVWYEVAEELSEVARVVMWSRPGLGDSEMGLVGRGSPRIVEELHIVLERLEMKPPYVLVGHGLGSFHMRTFAALHQDEVSALVLIDPSHEDWLKRLKRTRTPPEWKEMGDAFHKMVNLLPEGSRREFASVEEEFDRMSRLPTPLALPVWILTCTRHGEAERSVGLRGEDVALWEELHAELAASMHDGSVVEHVVRPDLGSDVLSTRPDSVVAGVVWALNETTRR